MYSQIIGTQQIVVTAVFLGVMLVVLMILRRKGGAIRASLKAGKRIAVIEIPRSARPSDYGLFQWMTANF